MSNQETVWLIALPSSGGNSFWPVNRVKKQHRLFVHLCSISTTLSLCLYRWRLRMWLLSRCHCAVGTECGSGVMPCLRCRGFGSTGSWQFFWPFPFQLSLVSSLPSSAASTSGRFSYSLVVGKIVLIGLKYVIDKEESERGYKKETIQNRRIIMQGVYQYFFDRGRMIWKSSDSSKLDWVGFNVCFNISYTN